MLDYSIIFSMSGWVSGRKMPVIISERKATTPIPAAIWHWQQCRLWQNVYLVSSFLNVPSESVHKQLPEPRLWCMILGISLQNILFLFVCIYLCTCTVFFLIQYIGLKCVVKVSASLYYILNTCFLICRCPILRFSFFKSQIESCKSKSDYFCEFWLVNVRKFFCVRLVINGSRIVA